MKCKLRVRVLENGVPTFLYLSWYEISDNTCTAIRWGNRRSARIFDKSGDSVDLRIIESELSQPILNGDIHILGMELELVV